MNEAGVTWDKCCKEAIIKVDELEGKDDEEEGNRKLE